MTLPQPETLAEIVDTIIEEAPVTCSALLACDVQWMAPRCTGTPASPGTDIVLDGNAAVLSSNYYLYGSGTEDDPAVLRLGCFDGTLEIKNENLFVVLRDANFWGTARTALNLHDDGGRITLRNFWLDPSVTLLSIEAATVRLEQSPLAEIPVAGTIGTVTSGSLTFAGVTWTGIMGGLTATDSDVQITGSHLEGDSNTCAPATAPTTEDPAMPMVPWTAVRQVVDVADETLGGHTDVWNRVRAAVDDAESDYQSGYVGPALRRLLPATTPVAQHLDLIHSVNSDVLFIASQVGAAKTGIYAEGGSITSAGTTFMCNMEGVRADATQVTSILTQFTNTAIPYDLENVDDLLPPAAIQDPLAMRPPCQPASDCTDPCDAVASTVSTVADLEARLTCMIAQEPYFPDDVDPEGDPPHFEGECTSSAWVQDEFGVQTPVALCQPHATIYPGSVTSAANATIQLVPSKSGGGGDLEIGGSSLHCNWSMTPIENGTVHLDWEPDCSPATFIGGVVNTTYLVTLEMVEDATPPRVYNATAVVSIIDPLNPPPGTPISASRDVEIGAAGLTFKSTITLDTTTKKVIQDRPYDDTPQNPFLSICDAFSGASPPVVVSANEVSLIASSFHDGVPLHGADFAVLGVVQDSLKNVVVVPDNINLYLTGAAKASGTSGCQAATMVLPSVRWAPGLGWLLLDGAGDYRYECLPMLGCSQMTGILNVPLVDRDRTSVHFLAGAPGASAGLVGFFNIVLLECGHGFEGLGMKYWYSESCGVIPLGVGLQTDCVSALVLPDGTTTIEASRWVTGCGVAPLGLISGTSHHIRILAPGPGAGYEGDVALTPAPGTARVQVTPTTATAVLSNRASIQAHVSSPTFAVDATMANVTAGTHPVSWTGDLKTGLTVHYVPGPPSADSGNPVATLPGMDSLNIVLPNSVVMGDMTLTWSNLYGDEKAKIRNGEAEAQIEIWSQNPPTIPRYQVTMTGAFTLSATIHQPDDSGSSSHLGLVHNEGTKTTQLKMYSGYVEALTLTGDVGGTEIYLDASYLDSLDLTMMADGIHGALMAADYPEVRVSRPPATVDVRAHGMQVLGTGVNQVTINTYGTYSITGLNMDLDGTLNVAGLITMVKENTTFIADQSGSTPATPGFYTKCAGIFYRFTVAGHDLWLGFEGDGGDISIVPVGVVFHGETSAPTDHSRANGGPIPPAPCEYHYESCNDFEPHTQTWRDCHWVQTSVPRHPRGYRS